MRFFRSKNHENYSTFSNETTSKLKVLPQRKNFGWIMWGSTTLISWARDWTIISIHFPINKNRAHGSVSSPFAGGYGSEFLAMIRQRPLLSEVGRKQIFLAQALYIRLIVNSHRPWSKIWKQSTEHKARQCSEFWWCLKMCEALSVTKCSRTHLYFTLTYLT